MDGGDFRQIVFGYENRWSPGYLLCEGTRKACFEVCGLSSGEFARPRWKEGNHESVKVEADTAEWQLLLLF